MFPIKPLILLQLLFASSICQDNLKLVITDSILPSPRHSIPALYDNHDNIYLVGGSDWDSHSVVKYTISDGSVETIVDEFNRTLGNAILTATGDIYYVSGKDYTFGVSAPTFKTKDIVKLNLNDLNNNVIVVKQLPYHTRLFSIIMDTDDNIYMFGGYDLGYESIDSITKYSIKNNTVVQHQGKLPSSRHRTSSVFDPDAGGIGYIFGGYSDSDGELDEIVKYELSTGKVTILDVELPYPIYNTCSVWDGNNAYIIGGTTRKFKSTDDRFSITRFNPSTNNITTFTFDNYINSLAGVGCTFVKKLNRIYIFAGFRNRLFDDDKIMYVDLNSLKNTSTIMKETSIETTTASLKLSDDPLDCSDREDFTMIPDPHCCNNFYVCYKGQGYANRCNLNLQFSPIKKVCLPAEVVKCGTSYNSIK